MLCWSSCGGWKLALCQVCTAAGLFIAIYDLSYRFTAITDQGIKNHTNAEAATLAVIDDSKAYPLCLLMT